MTMETKHTPGKWEMHEGEDYIHVETEDGTKVAEVYTEADGLLIAAAPDLLEACELALEAAPENSFALRDYLRLTIEKATAND